MLEREVRWRSLMQIVRMNLRRPTCDQCKASALGGVMRWPKSRVSPLLPHEQYEARMKPNSIHNLESLTDAKGLSLGSSKGHWRAQPKLLRFPRSHCRHSGFWASQR